MPSFKSKVSTPPQGTIIPIVSKGEQEVLYHIAYECTTKEIAELLNVSTETINTHRQNLMRKLSVKNTAGLVRVACQKRIIKF